MYNECGDNMFDYEIASKVITNDIRNIASKLGLTEDDIMCYGKDKAKILISANDIDRTNGKLILVTSTSPTPFGEGKTTLSIGIHDALCKLGKNSLAVLREPSLGPVFGIKGGATGGGFSQVIPMEDINLHFTGDIHAVTTANNLLSAVIDNELFHKSELNLDPKRICFERCMDINDRALRNINLNIIDRPDKFNITTASELMAILCLAMDMEDLRNRIDNILVGYTYDSEPVFVKQLNCTGSLLVILKDALKPNLVQTLEHNPVIIHGGPFANIAHGCNSVIATKLGLKLSDYVITEAGFGSDMGAIKFFDIKCRANNIYPNLVVINTTIRGLKYNGHDDLEIGLSNLEYHILNMSKFTNNILVVLNKFESDTDDDIELIKSYCNNKNVSFEISTAYMDGSNGAINVASKIIELVDKKIESKLLYDVNDELLSKIEFMCKEMYYAKDIVFTDNAIKKIELFNEYKLPICIAKTQYSISDDKNKLGFPKDYTVTITDLKLNNGAVFITVLMGDVMTMPGLGKKANYQNIDYVDGKIKGLF